MFCFWVDWLNKSSNCSTHFIWNYFNGRLWGQNVLVEKQICQNYFCDRLKLFEQKKPKQKNENGECEAKGLKNVIWGELD